MQQVPWASQLSWVGARDHFPIGTATDSAATGWKLPCEHSSRRRYKTVPRPVVVVVVPSSGTSPLDVVCGPDVPMATLPIRVVAAVVATVGDSVGAGVAVRVRVVAAGPGLVVAVIPAFAIVVADAVAVADAVFVAAAAVAKADVKSDDVVNGGDAASDAAHDCNAVGGSSAVAVPPDVGGVSVDNDCEVVRPAGRRVPQHGMCGIQLHIVDEHRRAGVALLTAARAVLWRDRDPAGRAVQPQQHRHCPAETRMGPHSRPPLSLTSRRPSQALAQ